MSGNAGFDSEQREFISPSGAAGLLSTLIRDELGVVVLPHQITALFSRRWRRLSLLAHAIHAGNP